MSTIFSKPGCFVSHPDFADPSQFAQRLANGKISWVAIYVQQGNAEQNASWLAAHDWFTPFRSLGIRVGIWGYLTTDPVADAALADALITKYDDGAHSLFYIADAEAEYTSWGGDMARSKAFVTEFRKRRPTRTAAMTSYGGATWDNSLATVFDYKSWQNPAALVAGSAAFEFIPQTYFQDAPEYEPTHCVEQAVANGWPITAVHPVVGVYDGVRGFRFGGSDWAYMIRGLQHRWPGAAGFSGWSFFNGENVTDDDLAAFALL